VNVSPAPPVLRNIVPPGYRFAVARTRGCARTGAAPPPGAGVAAAARVLAA